MTLRLASSFRLPVLLAAFSLAACNAPQAPAPAAPTASAPAAPVAGEPAAAPAAAPAADSAPAPAATATPPSGPAPVAGTDFVEIPGGQPFAPTAGKIEVAELFSYTCPHCAEFEPLVLSWRGKQTADVNFLPLAVPFGGNPLPFGKAFYAAETMGVLGKTHEAMFRAIHLERSLPVAPVSDEQIAAFYAKYGVDAAQFASTMASFAVDAKLKRATQFAQRSGVEGTPSLVVAGKYRVMGKSFEDMLRIADHLVAQERAKSAAPAAPASGG